MRRIGSGARGRLDTHHQTTVQHEIIAHRHGRVLDTGERLHARSEPVEHEAVAFDMGHGIEFTKVLQHAVAAPTREGAGRSRPAARGRAAEAQFPCHAGRHDALASVHDTEPIRHQRSTEDHAIACLLYQPGRQRNAQRLGPIDRHDRTSAVEQCLHQICVRLRHVEHGDQIEGAALRTRQHRAPGCAACMHQADALLDQHRAQALCLTGQIVGRQYQLCARRPGLSGDEQLQCTRIVTEAQGPVRFEQGQVGGDSGQHFSKQGPVDGLLQRLVGLDRRAHALRRAVPRNLSRIATQQPGWRRVDKRSLAHQQRGARMLDRSSDQSRRCRRWQANDREADPQHGEAGHQVGHGVTDAQDRSAAGPQAQVAQVSLEGSDAPTEFTKAQSTTVPLQGRTLRRVAHTGLDGVQKVATATSTRSRSAPAFEQRQLVRPNIHQLADALLRPPHEFV